jgi:dolichol-phosphate mannosyltransferase
METVALPILIEKIKFRLDPTDALVIAEDSPLEIFQQIQNLCTKAMSGSPAKLLFTHNQFKSGRGAAVRRGMIEAVKTFPNLVHVIECDGDGSHNPDDILKLKTFTKQTDLLIVSRYLKQSKIVGWPFARRFFSKILNLLIPKMLSIEFSDITNGLRRYSLRSVKSIIEAVPKTVGFIYLSETAQIINQKNFEIQEIPTIFVNRTKGKSTVTHRELLEALIGICQLSVVKFTRKI